MNDSNKSYLFQRLLARQSGVRGIFVTGCLCAIATFGYGCTASNTPLLVLIIGMSAIACTVICAVACVRFAFWTDCDAEAEGGDNDELRVEVVSKHEALIELVRENAEQIKIFESGNHSELSSQGEHALMTVRRIVQALTTLHKEVAELLRIPSRSNYLHARELLSATLVVKEGALHMVSASHSPPEIPANEWAMVLRSLCLVVEREIELQEIASEG